MKTPVSLSSLLAVAGESVSTWRNSVPVSVPGWPLSGGTARPRNRPRWKKILTSCLRPGVLPTRIFPASSRPCACVCRCSPFRCWPASLRRHGRTVRFPSCHWPALHRPVCSAWSRRSGAFPFYVTVALRRCAAGCCSSASVRNGRGVSLLTLIMKGVASCFPEPY